MVPNRFLSSQSAPTQYLCSAAADDYRNPKKKTPKFHYLSSQSSACPLSAFYARLILSDMKSLFSEYTFLRFCGAFAVGSLADHEGVLSWDHKCSCKNVVMNSAVAVWSCRAQQINPVPSVYLSKCKCVENTSRISELIFVQLVFDLLKLSLIEH